jgi:hypothetical protein
LLSYADSRLRPFSIGLGNKNNPQAGERLVRKTINILGFRTALIVDDLLWDSRDLFAVHAKKIDTIGFFLDVLLTQHIILIQRNDKQALLLAV